MKLFTGIFFILLALVFIGGSQSVFTVDQREQVLLLQLGQPIGEIRQPGLHFKIPFIQDVRRFDSRILSVDPAPVQMVISSSSDTLEIEPLLIDEKLENVPKTNEDREQSVVISGEPIIVDTFARYRISDPLMFLKTLVTIQAANIRIENIMNAATRSVLGNSTLKELLSEERAAIMQNIRVRVNQEIQREQLGIEIIDVRIVRADLTPQLRQSTVQRMISELRERATETRALGEEKALEIRSTADKEKTILLAEAQKNSQIMRGEGDKIAIKTYATAFNKDKDFYGFIRSLEAYENTLANPETRLILSPDSQFFNHFKGTR